MLPKWQRVASLLPLQPATMKKEATKQQQTCNLLPALLPLKNSLESFLRGIASRLGRPLVDRTENFHHSPRGYPDQSKSRGTLTRTRTGRRRGTPTATFVAQRRRLSLFARGRMWISNSGHQGVLFCVGQPPGFHFRQVFLY